MPNNLFLPIISACLSMLLVATASQARELTDSTGNKVAVPETVLRVWGTSPPVTALIYAIDPTLLIGLNLPFSKDDEAFIAPSARTLPVLGGWVGHGQTPNLEEVFKLAPQLAVLWDDGIQDWNPVTLRLLIIRGQCCSIFP